MYRNNTYFCYRKLDLEKMQQAAEYLRENMILKASVLQRQWLKQRFVPFMS